MYTGHVVLRVLDINRAAQRDELVSFSWAARLSAHDTAAALPLVSLAPRLATQVDVDHQHRRVVLEPPKPGRRVLRSQRGQGGVSGAVGPSGWAVACRAKHATLAAELAAPMP